MRFYLRNEFNCWIRLWSIQLENIKYPLYTCIVIANRMRSPPPEKKNRKQVLSIKFVLRQRWALYFRKILSVSVFPVVDHEECNLDHLNVWNQYCGTIKMSGEKKGKYYCRIYPLFIFFLLISFHLRRWGNMIVTFRRRL